MKPDRGGIALPGLAVPARGQLARFQLPPEGGRLVLPSAAVPVFLDDPAVAFHGDGHIAVFGLVLPVRGVRKKDRRRPSDLDFPVPGRGEGVGRRKQDGIPRAFRAAFDPDLEEGGGKAGIVGVQRDEGIEGAKGHTRGEPRILKSQDRLGKLPVEGHLAEMRIACHTAAGRTVAEAGVFRFGIGPGKVFGHVSHQDPDDAFPVRGLGLDGKKAVGIDAALVRPVEDFPVHEGSVARKPQRARADPAQRKADLPQMFSRVPHAPSSLPGGFPPFSVLYPPRIRSVKISGYEERNTAGSMGAAYRSHQKNDDSQQNGVFCVNRWYTRGRW